MGTKAERRATSERVAAYHEARLGELIEYITAAIDRYRAGEIDAYTVDETIHHYHRAARELWKFCWSGGGGTHIEIIAHVLDRMATDGETITGGTWSRRDSGSAPCRLAVIRKSARPTGLEPPAPGSPGSNPGRMTVLRPSQAAPRSSAVGSREGVISNWEDSPYDLRRRQLALAGAVTEIVIADELAATLRELRLLDIDCERLVFGMRAHGNGAVLAATDEELDELIVVAAEANHEPNRRRQHRLDAAFTALTEAAGQ